MTKRPSEKNKTWEKERRDRLNKAFEDLAKLLPRYDPTVAWSKNEIIQKSIAYISDLQEKHEKLLENQNPQTLRDYKELLDTIKFFRSRNSQLAEILNKANISLPPVRFPKFITDNPLFAEQKGGEFKSRPVGRPKKYSKLIVCNGDCNKTESKAQNVEASGPVDDPSDPGKSGQPAIITTSAAPAGVATVVTNPTTNAVISPAVLMPVALLPPASLLDISKPTPVVSIASSIQSIHFSQANCNVISIQKLPRLNNTPKRIARTKDGKVKILPYPVLKLYVRQASDKVAIPALKHGIVSVKKKHRKRKKSNTKPTVKRRQNKRKLLSSAASEHEKASKTVKSSGDEKSGNEKCLDKSLPECKQFHLSENIEPTMKANNPIPLSENDLPDEYFSSLQMPDTNLNSNSVSPTAAFLLSFPVLNASGGGNGKNDCGTEEGTDEVHSEKNISEGLENLNNFFSTKEYYKFCNQTYISPEKMDDEKAIISDKPAEAAIVEKKESISAQEPKLNYLPKVTESNLATISSWTLESDKIVNVAKTCASAVETSSTKDALGTLPAIVNSASDSNAHRGNSFSLYEPPKVSHAKLSGKDPLMVYSSCSPNKTSSPSTSNFSVSNIFTTSTTTISSSKTSYPYLPASKHQSEVLENCFLTSQTMGLTYQTFGDLPKNDGKAAVTSSITGCSPSKSQASKLRLTNINLIPNPIPVALPQPTNFPTAYNSYSGTGKWDFPTTKENQYLQGPVSTSQVCNMNKSSSSSANDQFVALSACSNATVVPRSASHIPDSKVTHPMYSLNTPKLKLEKVSEIQSSNQIYQANSHGASVAASTNSAIPADHHFVRPANSKPATSISTESLDPKFSLGIGRSSKSVYSTSFGANTNNSCAGSIQSADNSSKLQVSESTFSNIPNTPTGSNKINNLFNLKPHGIDGNESNISQGLPATTNYYYPPLVPPISSTFTFNLTSTTSSAVTMSAPSESQTYFPYPNVNQSAQWIPPSTTTDCHSSFTFSLTPSTPTLTSSQKMKSNCSSHSKAVQSCNSVSMPSLNSPKLSKVVDNFPEISASLNSYGPNSLAVSSAVHSNKNLSAISEHSAYPTTNFTFSLAKPKASTTTVSSELLKTLPSCSVTDSKYQPFYSPCNYESYANAYSKEATNFTFALTRPTQNYATSQSVDMKAQQRFNISFSIDATLGVNTSCSPQVYPNNTHSAVDPILQPSAQSFDLHQKASLSNKPNFNAATTSQDSANCYQEKQIKPSQKSHVNWMTSCQSADGTSQQPSSYYSPYVAPTMDISNKGNYFVQNSNEDYLPPWSPSKIIDTGPLFQSAPMQTYYSEMNASTTASSAELQKTYSKPYGEPGKAGKAFSKSSGSSNQASFFSVSQLVDQNISHPSKPYEPYTKNAVPQKGKDCRKNGNSSYSAPNNSHNLYHDQKASSLNNYSAEALISKKEKHRTHSVHHVHNVPNASYYSSQNDAMSSSYAAQNTDNLNYNPNYFYNYMPANQNFVQHSEYVGSYSNEAQHGRTGSSSNRKANVSIGSSKVNDKKCHSSATPLPNPTSYDANHRIPSIPPSVPAVESFDSSQYAHNNFQHSSWNTSKHTIGNYYSTQGSLPVLEDASLSSGCNQSATSSGTNITNFHLSTICPEISGKVGHTENNW